LRYGAAPFAFGAGATVQFTLQNAIVPPYLEVINALSI